MQAGGGAVVLEEVSAGYGRGEPVLREFSWSVPGGRTILLGPNGAGTSTMLKVAAGIVRPRSGRVRTDGAVGYMPQTVRGVAGLTVLQQVAYVGWLKGLARGVARGAAREALDRVDLLGLSGRQATRLSGGQLRRVGLAQALVGSSRVLLLDEPTAGLDPAQRLGFAEVVQGLDIPVLVATHQIEDIEESYDRVAVLVDGTIRFDGPLPDFLDLDPSRTATGAYVAATGGRTGRRHVG